MNWLEEVLEGDAYDINNYLETVGTDEFIRHIHEIKVKAAERAILDKMKELSGETK